MIDRKSLKARVSIGFGKALKKKLGKAGAKFAKAGIGARKAKVTPKPSKPKGKGKG